MRQLMGQSSRATAATSVAVGDRVTWAIFEAKNGVLADGAFDRDARLVMNERLDLPGVGAARVVLRLRGRARTRSTSSGQWIRAPVLPGDSSSPSDEGSRPWGGRRKPIGASCVGLWALVLVLVPGGHFDAYVGRGFEISSAAARDWFVEHLLTSAEARARRWPPPDRGSSAREGRLTLGVRQRTRHRRGALYSRSCIAHVGIGFVRPVYDSDY